MKIKFKKRFFIVLLVVLVLILVAGVGFWLWKGKTTFKTSNIGEKIYEKTQNPLKDKLPETNPFDKANPFKGIYKNPFE